MCFVSLPEEPFAQLFLHIQGPRGFSEEELSLVKRLIYLQGSRKSTAAAAVGSRQVFLATACPYCRIAVANGASTRLRAVGES